MAGLLGLFGGGGSDPADIYGDLFTPQQKAALRDQQMTGLLGKLAGAFAAGGMPSRMPIPLGSTIGAAAAAGLGGEDEAFNRMLTGMKTAEAVRQSQQQRSYAAQFSQFLQPIIERELAQMGRSPTLERMQAGAPGAPAVPGAPTGGLLASNAPPPPEGAPPGAAPAAAGLPSQFGVPQQDLSGYGLPARPGTGLPPAITSMPGFERLPGGGFRATGLLGEPPQAPLAQHAGLLGGGPGGASPFVPTPGAGDGGLPDLGQLRVEALSGNAEPAGGDKSSPEYLARRARDLALTQKYESGNRNIMQQVIGPQGGYNPSVGRVTGPSSASGLYQMIDPTYRHAAQLAGIDVSQWPRAMDAPEAVQTKLAEALYDEQGNRPWDPYNKRLAAARGASGLPNVGGVRVEQLGGEAAPAGAAPAAGVIPGIGISPQGLAALNALGKLGGLGEPFGSLLETYYKSPGYLAEKARTEAQAGKDVALKMDPLITAQTEAAKAKVELEYKPKIEEAVQKLQSPILKERAQAQADIDRISKELEQNRNAALTPTDATVFGPDGRIETQRMTALEFARRQQARAERATRGDTTFQPGDIVGAPVGAAPAEHEYRMTPQGALTAVPVPGTPAAEKAADVTNKKLQGEQQKLIARDTVVREVDNIGKLMSSATLPTTGFVGSLLQNLGGTSANDVRVARQTLEARLSTDAMNAMRAASPTGAALGNVSDTDMAIVRTALVNLDQSQSKEQFQERLQILKQAYVDAVHGPGMSRLLPETPVLKTPAAPAAPSGAPRERRWNPATNRLE